MIESFNSIYNAYHSNVKLAEERASMCEGIKESLREPLTRSEVLNIMELLGIDRKSVKKTILGLVVSVDDINNTVILRKIIEDVGAKVICGNVFSDIKGYVREAIDVTLSNVKAMFKKLDEDTADEERFTKAIFFKRDIYRVIGLMTSIEPENIKWEAAAAPNYYIDDMTPVETLKEFLTKYAEDMFPDYYFDARSYLYSSSTIMETLYRFHCVFKRYEK